MSAALKLDRAALLYAERFGFAVFPCVPRGKVPLTLHGWKDATTDPDQIRRWWWLRPDANVGIATGIKVVVLDEDPRHGGDASRAELESRYGNLPETPQALTGGDGVHWMFNPPADGIPIYSSNGKIAPGLDVRAINGYVVAPPSIHESGNLYRWEVSARIGDLPLADIPGWLLHLMRAATSGPSRPLPDYRIDFQRIAAGLPEGERDWELFRLACALRQRGYDRDHVEHEVLAAAKRCRPPFPPRMALAKVKSAWRYAR